MLLGLVCLCARGSGLAATAPAGRAAAGPGFDRQIVEAELSRQVQGESVDALQTRLRRLAEVHASLDLADLPQDERRALRERVLARMAEVGLLLRPRGQEVVPRARSAAPVSAFGASLAGLVEESSGLLVLVLGGLVVCFALGNLAGYRRGARQASYYGDGDPRMRFIARGHNDPRLPAARVTLEQIRRRLRDGHAVLLQLGYEIEPGERVHFLAAVTRMQEALRGMEGHTFTVWEDPRHPNRFYECLECRDLAALDRLMALDDPLPELAAEVEACRPPDGWIIRRAWWGIGNRTYRSRPASRGIVRPGG